MKKNSIIYLLILIALSLWVGRDLFRPEFTASHDGLYHIVRLEQFHESLLSGQFPVRWAPTLLNGLGYPLFVVNYNLPYYVAELFHLYGLSLFSSLKAVFLISLIGGALSSFWWLSYLTKNHFAALVGSIFFTIAPYRLANIFERGALGETLAYVFLPLLFLGAQKIINNKSINFFVLGLSGLILSHTVVAIIFFPWAIAYIALFSVNHKIATTKVIKTILISFCLCAFQLVPALLERKYMQFNDNLLTAYIGHFKNLYQLFRIPHEDVNIGTRFQVGLMHSLVLLISFIFILTGRKLKNKSQQLFFTISTVLAVFLITPASQELWNIITPLKFILYPWRLLGVTAFSSAILASLFLVNVKSYQKILGLALIVGVIFVNRHYLKVDKFIPATFPSEMLMDTGTTQNEFAPIGLSATAIKYAEPPVEALDQPVSITNFYPQPNLWEFTASSNQPNRLKIGLLYFPGWQIKVDNKIISIETNVITSGKKPKDLRGLMVISIPQGKHQITAYFTETTVRKIGNYLSLISLLMIIYFSGKKYVLRSRFN